MAEECGISVNSPSRDGVVLFYFLDYRLVVQSIAVESDPYSDSEEDSADDSDDEHESEIPMLPKRFAIYARGGCKSFQYRTKRQKLIAYRTRDVPGDCAKN